MATDNDKNERIWTIACVDGSRYSTSVRDHAIWLSQVLNAPFKALHAIEHNPNVAVSDLTGAIGLGAQEHLLSELTELEQQRNKLEIQKGRQMLETVKVHAEQAGIEHPTLVQRHGSLIESLIDLENDARVIVVGIRGEVHEDNNQHLGAHLESLVRSVNRPFLVVNREFTPPKAAMLAYDGSSCCLKGLEMVKNSPLFDHLPVHLVNVSGDLDKAQVLVAQAKQVLEGAGRTVHTAVLQGLPHEALCQYQKENEIDLTVMGAFSHNRLRELVFGSFTIRMLLNTEKPLLLLR
ncbi:MAG: universal stress protein [Reinekea sp.]|jgi:nucleotide-binding universal stress UspA family protein